MENNILYQVKKEAYKRSSPHFQPNSEDDDIRTENQKLRTKIRAQQTQIIRLNAKVDDLVEQLSYSKYRKVEEVQSGQKSAQTFSKVPFMLENKELKENIEVLNQQMLKMNAKNNELAASVRQLESDKYQLEVKVKELDFLEKRRQERFKDQVERLTPIIIQQPSEFSTVKNAVIHLTKFIRKKVFQVPYNLFLASAKECQGKKKINSFTVFVNFWKELKNNRSYGFAAVSSCYKSLSKVMKIIDEGYGEIDEEQYKGNLNQWVYESLVDIKHTAKEKQRKLFRYMGLAYRCSYPIKGENFEMSENIRAHLEHTACLQSLKLITEE